MIKNQKALSMIQKRQMKDSPIMQNYMMHTEPFIINTGLNEGGDDDGARINLEDMDKG